MALSARSPALSGGQHDVSRPGEWTRWIKYSALLDPDLGPDRARGAFLLLSSRADQGTVGRCAIARRVLVQAGRAGGHRAPMGRADGTLVVRRCVDAHPRRRPTRHVELPRGAGGCDTWQSLARARGMEGRSRSEAGLVHRSRGLEPHAFQRDLRFRGPHRSRVGRSSPRSRIRPANCSFTTTAAVESGGLGGNPTYPASRFTLSRTAFVRLRRS